MLCFINTSATAFLTQADRLILTHIHRTGKLMPAPILNIPGMSTCRHKEVLINNSYCCISGLREILLMTAFTRKSQTVADGLAGH